MEGEEKKFKCQECNAKFARNFNLNRHIHLTHSDSPLNRCELCGQEFTNYDNLLLHHKKEHTVAKGFQIRESAFRKSVLKYRYTYPLHEDNIKIEHFHNEEIQKKVRKTILHELAKKSSIKFELILIAEMVQLNEENKVFVKIQVPFRSYNIQASVQMIPELKKDVESCFAKIVSSIEEFQFCGSGYVFSQALALDLEINKFSGIRIGKNKKMDNILNNIPNKKSLENVPGKKFCLLYCIIKFLYPQVKFEMSEEKLKPFLKLFKCVKGKNKISFPIKLKDVPKFIAKNSHLDIKINILYYNKTSKFKEILPVQYGVGDGNKILNLLVVPHKKGHHFVIIKNLDKFLRKSYRNEKGRKCYDNTKICANCLNSFRSEKVLKEHEKLCTLKGPRKEECPKPERSKIYFKHYEYVVQQELIGFADFEACMIPSNEVCEICSTLRCKCVEKSFTRVENYQKSICYSFVIVNSQNELLLERYYAGKKANEHFLNTLLEIENGWLSSFFDAESSTLRMTKSDEIQFEAASCCYMCKKPFTEKDAKVRGN